MLGACSDDSYARFEVAGVSQHAECLDKVFPYEPYFLTARDRQDSVGILMQSEGGGFQDSDVLYFEIFDVAAAKAGETLEFSVPGTLDARAIGELEVAHTCPDLVESMYLTGALRFDKFSTEQDDLIVGELVGAGLRSIRTETEIATTLTGSWQIKVRDGQPYEEFYAN